MGAGEDIAQLNSTAAKQREAELLLDDSDSDMESDVVFAHIMARQHGGHARRGPMEPLGQQQNSPAADGLLLDLRGKAVEPHLSAASPSMTGPDEGDGGSTAAEKHEEAVPCADRRDDLAAASEGVRDAEHTAAALDSAGSCTAQHASPETPAAASDVAAPGASGEAATNAAAQPLGSGPSLHRSVSQQRGKKPSQKAVGAMWELLECSIAPQLQLDPGMPTQREQFGCTARCMPDPCVIGRSKVIVYMHRDIPCCALWPCQALNISSDLM